MSVKLNVLIPDGHSTWAMAVIHCLSEVEDYNLFVLSNKKHTPARYSKYTGYFKYVERGSDSEWEDIVANEIRSNSIDIIIPIAEHEILFLIQNGSTFSDSVKLIPLPELSSFQTASNKNVLNKFCEKNELPHPKSIFCASNHLDAIKKADIKFPILIKPLHQKGGDGIQKYKTSDDFNNDYGNTTSSILIQEFINGYDIDCSVLCLDGSILSYTIQRGNLKGHNDFAPQLGFDLYENPELFAVVKKAMAKLNWSGIAHLDLRYDELTNQYCIIEINPRFWGSIGASLNSGVNFPHLAIQLALYNKIDNLPFKPGHYMRLKGVIKTLKRRPGFIFNRSYLLNYTEVKPFLQDPKPTMFRFVEWLGRKIGMKNNT